MMTVAMPSIAPVVAEAYGVPVYMIGYQVSIMYIGVIVGLTIGANLSTRLGACRTIQAGLALEALGMLLATTRSFAALVPGSLIMGFGYALLTPASSHLLLRFTPEHRRNMIFSLKQTGVPIGSVLAAATGPSLALTIGWQATLWLFVVFVCVVTAVLQWHRERWDNDRNPGVPLAANPFAALTLMWRNPMIRILSFTAAALSCGQITIQNFTVAMFYEQLGTPLVQAGLILGAAQIGGMTGRLFWGWVADRTRDCILVLALLSGILLVVSLFCATLEFGWPFAAIVALFFVFGATASGWHGAFLSEIARIAPAGRVSTATGGALLLGNVSATMTPLMFAGVFAAIHNYAYTFALLAIPALASLLLLRSARKLSRRSAAR
jgi:MFS family permease